MLCAGKSFNCKSFTNFISSSHHTSLPLIIDTGVCVRFKTITFCTVSHCVNASSITAFNGISLLPLKPPSAVITNAHAASMIRSAIDCAEKPPKTTECMAPILAQAKTAMANSGTMGI